MELSRPPLVVAFELSEKRKAIVADALAGASAVVYAGPMALRWLHARGHVRQTHRPTSSPLLQNLVFSAHRPRCTATAQASVLLADRAHDARGRAAGARRALHLLQDRLIVRGNRRHRKLRLHEYNLVAPGLEIVEQVHRGLGRRMLEIVQQHDAFAMLLQLFHHRLPDLLGLAHFEVEGIHVGGENGDVALAEIVDELLWLPQSREAEIGHSRSADRPVHGTDAHLDLVLGVVLYGLDLAVDLALTLGFRQILVTPSMRTDGVPGCGPLLEDPGLIRGMQADREEDRLGAVRGERGEHRVRVLRPGAVVEGEHHLAFAKEIMALEVLESEAGAAGGVDLDHTADPQSVGIVRA